MQQKLARGPWSGGFYSTYLSDSQQSYATEASACPEARKPGMIQVRMQPSYSSELPL